MSGASTFAETLSAWARQRVLGAAGLVAIPLLILMAGALAPGLAGAQQAVASSFEERLEAWRRSLEAAEGAVALPELSETQAKEIRA